MSKLVIGMVGMVLLGSMLTACDRESVEMEPVIRPVRYERVVRQGTERTRIFSGAARARRETLVSFRVGGMLVEFPVIVGDQVKAGQLIGRLDPTDYEVQVQEAQAGLARASAEQRNAQADYERTLSLYENRNASRSDLDAARAQAESADAQVTASRQHLEAARLQLSYSRLYAPEDCTIAERFVERNQNVAIGQSIVRLDCGDCPEVTVSVAETIIEGIQPGTNVEVSVDALPGQSFDAKVTEIGVASGRAGTAYPVTVVLQEQCDAVRSGMAADVAFSFPLETAPGELIVPGLSVGEDREGRYVFVLEPDDEGNWRARRRPVEMGEVLGDYGIVIRSGIHEGELVVTAGTRRITDGQQVKLLAAGE